MPVETLRLHVGMEKRLVGIKKRLVGREKRLIGMEKLVETEKRRFQRRKRCDMCARRIVYQPRHCYI